MTCKYPLGATGKHPGAGPRLPGSGADTALRCLAVSFTETMDHVAQLFEALGAAVLLGGLFVAAGLAIRSMATSRNGRLAYQVLREAFGGVILLGLEILVAADLVRTVAVAPTLDNVLI